LLDKPALSQWLKKNQIEREMSLVSVRYDPWEIFREEVVLQASADGSVWDF
jgi:hypothetical protein